jgi:uncharacterized cupin superfamily protein
MTQDREVPQGRLVKSAEVAWEEWTHGARFGSRYKPLGKLAGGSHVGVQLEELAPGFQSCPVHYHLLEEEHLFALEGSATLCWGDQQITLVAGDYVCFPAGDARGHALINDGGVTFRFLMIGESKPDEVCIYPDSDKIMVRAAKQVFRRGGAVDYWSDEPGRPGVR